MADFNKLYPLVQDAEKDYQHDAGDPGNYNSKNELVGTNFGISAPLYEAYLGQAPTADDMKNITPETAKDILKASYWDALIKGDQLLDQRVANILTDHAITSEKHALQLAEERLWLSGYPVDLQNQHNTLSTQQLEIFNGMTPEQSGLFVNAYAKDRMNYYEHLPPKMDHFKHGWEQRVALHFPEDKALSGWNEVKQDDYALTAENIQYIVSHHDLHQMDGIPGERTQAEFKAWQETQGLYASGYLDPPSRSDMLQQIRETELTRELTDINKNMDSIRSIRLELNDPVQPPVPVYTEPGYSDHHVHADKGYSDHSGAGSSVSIGTADTHSSSI